MVAERDGAGTGFRLDRPAGDERPVPEPAGRRHVAELGGHGRDMAVAEPVRHLPSVPANRDPSTAQAEASRQPLEPCRTGPQEGRSGAPHAEPAMPAAGPVIDLAADGVGSDIEHILASLDTELIGLANLKRRVREIAALLLVDRARQEFGLTASRPTMHMSFTGAPGTGKTTVALRMAEILYALGYIRKPKVHSVTRDDLVGQFIGHTAPKTKEALAKAAGGVLFIDEAYYLFRPENERDYGQEVIELLLPAMEAERASVVVIFAGYPDRMRRFFATNPGLSSRVSHHLEFSDYSHSELVEIAEIMVARQDFRFDATATSAFAEYLHLRMVRPQFANARSVRNAIDRCRLRHAKRLVELGRPLTKTDLITLTGADVYGSSVFTAIENLTTVSATSVRDGTEAPCPKD